MTHTFDIRFARTAGLAAFLEAPENRFHWKGGGLLRIDAQSVSFTVERSLLALFAGKRTQRIPAENLRDVYREGEALRVEFLSGETAREVLPFWVNDRDTAAQIVRLLPTTQTVEIEHSTDATHSGRPRADVRVLLALGVVLAVLTGGSWAIYQRMNPAVAMTPVERSDGAAPAPPDANSQWVEAPAPAASPRLQPEAVTPPPISPEASPSAAQTTPSFLEPPPVVLSPPPPLPLPLDYVRSEDFVIPIAKNSPAWFVARAELEAFEREAAELEKAYRLQRNLLNSGALTADDFAAKLDAIEMRWWDTTFRIFDNEALADPKLLDLRASMLATARLWRNFLSNYANGLRKRDHVLIANSFDDLARAQEMQSRARLFLR